MTLILLATSMAGVLASKGMFVVGLHNVAIRYPVTVLCAYLVFFGVIKAWLWLMTNAPTSSSQETDAGVLNNIVIPLPSGGSAQPSFSGKGGAFDGGGASDDFGDTPAVALPDKEGAIGVGAVAGNVVDGVTSEKDGLILMAVLALLALLLFSVLGAGIFLIYQAPAILGEAAFNAVLAASLAHSSHKMHQPDWMGSIFKATWKPFAIVLALSIAAGLTMHHYLPSASRIIDVIHMVYK